MSTTAGRPIDTPAEHVVVSTRDFAVPRETVFRAFTDPDTLARWWGPAGFTNTFHHFDLRPGGAWRFTMHGPDGKTYAITKHFLEVVEPERIVLEHIQPMHRFRMAMTYAAHHGGTRLTWRMTFEEPQTAEMRAFLATANEENFDRLAAVLKAGT